MHVIKPTEDTDVHIINRFPYTNNTMNNFQKPNTT